MKQFSLLLCLIYSFAFSQTEETIDSGNSKLHYKTFGNGKPILIINGGPGMNCSGFDSVAREITNLGCKAIIYDQRGTGKSTLENINTKTITMDLMAEDIEQLRKHLKIKKWTILGHSFGGMLASYYAAKYPQRIDRLIFSSSGGVTMKFTSYVHNRLNANLTKTEKDSVDYYQAKLEKEANPEDIKKRAKFLANAYVVDKSKAPIIAERLTEIIYEVNELVFDNLQKIKFDCSRSFTGFKNPVLVLQGKNDIISTGTAQEIADAFPNSKLVLMDNCAHYGWLDKPEIYFNSINSFLNN